MHPQITPSRHERALTQIAQCIRERPHSVGGLQLRQFLWSLYNEHYLVNLCTLVERLESAQRVLVAEVLNAAWAGNLTKDDVERAIVVSGERMRWEARLASNETRQRLEEAERIVASLERSLPPGRTHADLMSLLRHFAELRLEWTPERDEDVPF